MLFKKTLSCLLLIVPFISVFSKDKDSLVFGNISGRTIILPRIYNSFEFKSSISVLFTRFPIDWIEITADVPSLQLHTVLGLPAGFSLNGNIQTVYFTTQTRLGPRWNVQWKKFSAGIGCDFAWMFGNMNIYEFNNHASAIFYYPHLAFGFTTGDIALTVTGELNYAGSLKITSGKAEITHEKEFFAGRSFGFFVEQRLWKNSIMIIGFTGYYHRFYYPAWPSFSFLTRYYFIPQLSIGLIL